MPHNTYLSLMYHSVFKNQDEIKGLTNSVSRYFTGYDEFEAQMAMLAERAECMTLEELKTGNIDPEKRASGKKLVHITFDDGWRGTLDYAVPILEKYKLEATLFITTNFINKPEFIRVDELLNMPECIKIGSHAQTHKLLEDLPLEEAKKELANSKEILEDLLEIEIDTFAFPGGSMNRSLCNAAREIGYKYLFNSRIGLSKLKRDKDIKRVPIYKHTSLNNFERYLQHHVQSEFIRQKLINLPKKLLTRQQYLYFREYLIGDKAVHPSK